MFYLANLRNQSILAALMPQISDVIESSIKSVLRTRFRRGIIGECYFLLTFVYSFFNLSLYLDKLIGISVTSVHDTSCIVLRNARFGLLGILLFIICYSETCELGF